MAFPTTSLLDNFNRANEGAPPSASWGGQIRSSGFGLYVVSNRCANATGSLGTSYWGTSFGGAQEVYATVAVKPSTGDTMGLWMRIGTPGASANGYRMEVDASGNYGIYRITNQVIAATLATGSLTLSTNDKLGLGAVGSAITFYQYTSGAWSTVTSVTDSTYTSGYIGLNISWDTGAASPGWEDFSGGLTVAVSSVPAGLRLQQAVTRASRW